MRRRLAAVLLEVVEVTSLAAVCCGKATRGMLTTGLRVEGNCCCLSGTQGLVKLDKEDGIGSFAVGTLGGNFSAEVVDEVVFFTAEPRKLSCLLKLASICAKTGTREPLPCLSSLLLAAAEEGGEEVEEETEEEAEM